MSLLFEQINFSSKKVFLRVDFNVPLDNFFRVTDETRIVAALPTIKHILLGGGSLILASHLGRPKGIKNSDFSLKHILLTLKKHLPDITIHFAEDCIGDQTKTLCDSLQQKEIVLLENLRFYSEEEKGDAHFAKSLSQFADFYVNDAFGTAHRAHASTAVMAQFFDSNAKSFGYLMENEIRNAERIMKDAVSPFCAILGGAKVSDKIGIIDNLIQRANHIIIGGGMAYTFLKAQGYSIGTSIVELDLLETTQHLLTKAKELDCEIHLPVDFVIADAFSNEARIQITENQDILDDWMGLDCGPKTVAYFEEIVFKSKTILWNGPMGVFEMENFRKGTVAVAEAISESTQKGAFSLVGGGDSVAAIKQFGLEDKVSYISTGGGALLEFFEGKQLPGIQAIQSS